LHWYGQQKLTAKSIKPTQKKTKYITYCLHTHAHAHKRNTNKRCTHEQSNYTNKGKGTYSSLWINP